MCVCVSVLCLYDQVYSPLNLFLVGMTQGEGLKDHISATFFKAANKKGLEECHSPMN